MSHHNGILNIASGKVTTFKEIANKINNFYSKTVSVIENPRKGKMPHGGYRSFNIDKINKLFPDYTMTAIDDGLKDYYKKLI